MAPHVVEEAVLANGDDMNSFSVENVWPQLKKEAKKMAEESSGDLDSLGSQLLPSFMEFTVLKWGSLEECLASNLSEKLAWKAAPTEQIYNILVTAFREGKSSRGEPIRDILRKDLIVIMVWFLHHLHGILPLPSPSICV
jgi:hypothetical protein